MIKALFIGLCMLALSACANIEVDGKVPLSPLGQQVADTVVDVSDQNRDLRVCWLAAGAVEVLTDLAQRGGDSQLALGHLMLLQGAIDKARMTDPFWVETDTADVALLFAGVLKAAGKSRLSQILLGAPTVSNFLNVTKRAIVLSVKGHAVMRDINRVLQGVEDGIYQKADAWTSCENRTAMNRDTLHMLTGVPVSGTDRGARLMPLDGWYSADGNPGFGPIRPPTPMLATGPMDGDWEDGWHSVEYDIILDDSILYWPPGEKQWAELDLLYPDGWVGTWEERVGIGRPIA